MLVWRGAANCACAAAPSFVAAVDLAERDARPGEIRPEDVDGQCSDADDDASEAIQGRRQRPDDPRLMNPYEFWAEVFERAARAGCRHGQAPFSIFTASANRAPSRSAASRNSSSCSAASVMLPETLAAQQ